MHGTRDFLTLVSECISVIERGADVGSANGRSVSPSAVSELARMKSSSKTKSKRRSYDISGDQGKAGSGPEDWRCTCGSCWSCATAAKAAAQTTHLSQPHRVRCRRNLRRLLQVQTFQIATVSGLARRKSNSKSKRRSYRLTRSCARRRRLRRQRMRWVNCGSVA